MYENVTPFENRILIKKYDKEDRTEAGLYLLESEENQVRKGVVVAVGKGISVYDGSRCDMDIKLGSIVYYLKGTGTELDNVCTMLRREEILGFK